MTPLCRLHAACCTLAVVCVGWYLHDPLKRLALAAFAGCRPAVAAQPAPAPHDDPATEVLKVELARPSDIPTDTPRAVPLVVRLGKHPLVRLARKGEGPTLIMVAYPTGGGIDEHWPDGRELLITTYPEGEARWEIIKGGAMQTGTFRWR